MIKLHMLEERMPHGIKNPLREDFYHMGQRLGTNAYLLISNHPDQLCEYLRIVNTITGEILQVEFTEFPKEEEEEKQDAIQLG